MTTPKKRAPRKSKQQVEIPTSEVQEQPSAPQAPEDKVAEPEVAEAAAEESAPEAPDRVKSTIDAGNLVLKTGDGVIRFFDWPDTPANRAKARQACLDAFPKLTVEFVNDDYKAV